MDLAARRQFFAEEVQAVCNLRTPSLVEALATVPRERYLPPGPWLVRGEVDIAGPPRPTPDADPRHVYHNLSIGIDPARQLFNGAPGVVSIGIDALGLRAGERVLHVGSGTGYYSAVLGHCVGAAGRVLAVEVDEGLAARARENLAGMPWIEARHGGGTDLGGETFDAIFASAGVTHPPEAWLQALAGGGRMVVPLTFTMPQMGTIGKGVVTLVSRAGDGQEFAARPITMIAIYSAVGLRDDGFNDQLRASMTRAFWPTFTRLRRDPHDASPACWLHGDSFCFSS